MAVMIAMQHGFGLLLLDTGTTQRKDEFVTATHWQDRVKLAGGWKNVDGGDTKIRPQGLIDRLNDDLRMTDGVRAVLVDPLLKGGDIHVAYLLALPGHGMQNHRACSSPKKGLAGLQGWYEIERAKKLRNGRVIFYQTVPLTLPHFYYSVTSSEQGHAFVQSGLIKFLHGSIRSGIMFGVSRGKTSGTCMVNTPVQLVNSASEGIETINEIRRDSSSHGLFTAIADVLDPVRTGPLLGDLLFLVIEPLQGLEGMVDIGPPPSTDRLDGDGIGS